MTNTSSMLKVQFVSLYTLVLAQILRIFRLWPQTLLPPVITMTLYFLIFGHLIGSQLHKIHGYTYMQYITPGLVMMAAITNSYAHVSSVVFGAKFQRCIEEILVSPTLSITYILANVLGGVVRGLLSSLVVYIVSMFFTPLHLLHPILALIVIILSCTLLSLGAFINGILAKRFDDVAIFPTFVLTPLTYLGGVFYSISLLPHIWEIVSRFNPIFYLINAFRYSFFGFSDLPYYDTLIFIFAFILVLFICAYRLMYKGVGLRS